MTYSPVLDDMAALSGLTDRLRSALRVANPDTADSLAGSVAYSLASLETQSNYLLSEVLPSLVAKTSDEDVRVALNDAGLVIQQIYWHIKLCKHWHPYLLDPEEEG